MKTLLLYILFIVDIILSIIYYAYGMTDALILMSMNTMILLIIIRTEKHEK